VHGEQPKQGKKRSLEEIVEACVSGEFSTLKEISEVDPMAIVRHHRGLETLLNLHVAPRDKAPKLEYIWGPSGSGKTLAMYRDVQGLPNWNYGDPYTPGLFDRVYIKTPCAKSSGTDWFKGLTPNHDIIVLEEFASSSCSITWFTSFINPGPCQLPTLGGLVQCRATKVIVLSNTNPENLWPDALTESRSAVMRRLKDPNVGTIKFHGYGPNHDQPFCKCPSKEKCPFVHDPSGPVALAVGARLPPPGGYLFKPPV